MSDLSITRTSFDWGVKLPEDFNDPKHVMYVWLDALMNYITALGYGTDNNKYGLLASKGSPNWKRYLTVHAIFWPAFLMSPRL